MDATNLKLTVDNDRIGWASTGIFIRAMRVVEGREKWGSWDLAELTTDSVVAWLRSRGPDSPTFAINTVLALLGHERRIS